ncbi:MAG: OmpH family outer membrane protein [Deferribacteraceae bacterium]|jgi:outer membrane protein|nr:OmpH family outer membrane protein [Deferribacteraceae bacterium]
MKKFFIVLTVFAMTMIATSAMAQAKIAIIDMERCVMTSDAGKKASEDMRAYEVTLNEKIQPLRDEYTKLENDYRAQEKVLADAAKQTKIEALQKKAVEVETAMRTATADAQKKNDELLSSVFKDLNGVIATVAKASKCDAVFHKQMLAYGPDVTDITDDVIAAYNKQFNAKK